MYFFVVSRRLARLQYLTARLPLTVLDQYVVARYLDDRALPRRSFELFLGSMDGLAGWLLAGDRISRPGHAVSRPESAAPASELAAEQEARWAQCEETLQAASAAARQQAREGIHSATADQQARRPDAADNRRLVRYRPEEPPAPASSP